MCFLAPPYILQTLMGVAIDSSPEDTFLLTFYSLEMSPRAPVFNASPDSPPFVSLHHSSSSRYIFRTIIFHQVFQFPPPLGFVFFRSYPPHASPSTAPLFSLFNLPLVCLAAFRLLPLQGSRPGLWQFFLGIFPSDLTSA